LATNDTAVIEQTIRTIEVRIEYQSEGVYRGNAWIRQILKVSLG
jgi:hypothetical protein